MDNKSILDLKPIFTGEKKSIDISFEFVPADIENDINFPSPIKVSGKVFEKASSDRGADSLVCAEIILGGEYITGCARCLEELTIPVNMSAEYAVATELQNEETEGCLLAQDGMLDVGEVADTLFFMNIPSKHLCKDDCKGLCQGCGKNLNFEKCSCTGKTVDPRLAVLKKLLDKQEN